MSIYRTALFVEGVPVRQSALVGDVTVVPVGILSGGELAATLTRMLADQGFVTDLRGAAMVASMGAARPVTLLMVQVQSDDISATESRFQQLFEQTTTALVLVHGGEARHLGRVVECTDDGLAWRTLLFQSGGPSWIRSELQALAPDGYRPPIVSVAAVVDRLTARPLAGLWCSLFASAVGEERWDVRVLRLWSLLETIARRAIPGGTPVVDERGTPLELSPGNPASSEARAIVYVLLRHVHDALELPVEVRVCHPDHELWHEVYVWYLIRNSVAHAGAWPQPGGKRATRVIVEAAHRAARPGGHLEEGLERYANHLKANVEAVLWAGVLGHLDEMLESAGDPGVDEE